MGVALVVVGASLGGFDALLQVFGALEPKGMPPVAIVQHRGADAGSVLCSHLGDRMRLPVREAEDKMPIEPETVYLAPPDYHLLVETTCFTLSVDRPELGARPSINVLFESAADAFGSRVLAILLTGSSEDGAAGIQRVKRAGGVAVVQDPAEAASAVAPRAAISAAPVDHVLRLAAIGALLARMARDGTVLAAGL
jgi:two-component system chemotaxis response regulator CheB